MARLPAVTRPRLIGKNAPPIGQTPAIALLDPKYPQNVGMVQRLASCYGFSQVWFTGNRVSLDPEKGYRLPREERMRGYQDVTVIQYDLLFDQFTAATPVAVEVRKNAEPLHTFEHPENPLYVFGPEDGSIPGKLLAHCHRFLVIPTQHCLNLATAVATVLWDRRYKRYLLGLEHPATPGDHEQRGLKSAPEEL